MQVNVCFWGIPRSLPFTRASIEARIFHVLKQHQISQKTYANWNTTNKYSNPRAGERGTRVIGLQPGLALDICTSQDQNAVIDAAQPASKFLRHGIPPQWTSFMETFQNHIRSLVSLQKVQQSAPPKNVYVFLRADVKYLHDLPVSLLAQAAQNPKFFASPNFANELGHALNDRFAICGSEAARVYANRIDQAESQSHQKRLHSEEFLSWTMKSSHMNIIQFPQFFFQRIRCDGSVAAADRNFK